MITYYGFPLVEGIHRTLETAARKAAKLGLTVHDLRAFDDGRERFPFDWEMSEFEIYLREQ